MRSLNTLSRILLAALVLAVAAPRAAFSQALRITDSQVQTRAAALQAAGSFEAEGFKIRDCHWWGTLPAGESKVIEVNLFAGNQYRFVAAASSEATGLMLAVYDEDGAPVSTRPCGLTAQAAVAFSPTVSGPYYVRVAVDGSSKEGPGQPDQPDQTGEPATFCLLYSYK